MRFLVDECISPRLVDALVALGHDAVSVRSLGLAGQGYADSDLWALAKRENHILISLDHDHRDIGSDSELPPQSGVIWLRCTNSRRARLEELLVTALRNYPSSFFEGHVVQVSPNRVHQRR